MSEYPSWIFILNTVVHGILTGLTLAIVFVGWTRQRQVGYLVLMAWALSALFSLAGNAFLFPIVTTYLRNIFPRSQSIVIATLPLPPPHSRETR